MMTGFRIVGILFCIAGFVISSGCSAPAPANHGASATDPSLGILQLIEQHIRRGDNNFKRYSYAEALNDYQHADRALYRALYFDRESVIKDGRLNQRFINLQALVQTRIKLTQIAFEVVRLHSLSGDSPSDVTASNVGVAECDDFLAKYEACVSGKVPKAERATFKTLMETRHNSWREVAKTPQGKAWLVQVCKDAADQAKTSLGSYGCSW